MSDPGGVGPAAATTSPSSDSQSSPGGPGRGYLAALDGVRGIAVMAVLLFHGGVAWAPGGFLGVDIFFVLSGFLITRLLLDAWDSRGRLSLGDFWLRRTRRLLPALLAVVLVTSVAILVLGSPIAATVRDDGLASLLYVSNWWFMAEPPQAGGLTPSPFRHTWSLAIEEQWYILLPLVLLLVLPLRLPRHVFAWILLGLAGLSALWMGILAQGQTGLVERAYYGTDTRIQALLIGSALAFLPLATGSRRLAVAATGSALLVLAAVATVGLDEPWLYRGGFLLVAVASAAVIADVTVRPEGRLARGLSWTPLVRVGVISYGLYLWHWPVYVLVNEPNTGLQGWPLLAVRLLITFLLAWASYVLIERPVRSGALSALRPPVRWTVILGAVAVTVAALVAVPIVVG